MVTWSLAQSSGVEWNTEVENLRRELLEAVEEKDTIHSHLRKYSGINVQVT